MRQRVHVSRIAGRRVMDRGVALILVMLSLLVLSVLTAAIIFTARTETFASYSYKLDTQADYLAKAGIQQAVAWLRSSRYTIVSQTQAPTYYSVTSSGAPLNLYTSNASPVLCISGCATTTANSNKVQFNGFGSESWSASVSSCSSASNYPISSAVTNFCSDLVNVQVTGDAGNSGIFSISALLLSYQTVSTGTPPTLQNSPMETWLITSHATWTASSGSYAPVATAEEQAVIQPIYMPTSGESLYGYCSVTMGGSAGTCTDAYNSALGSYAGGNATAASGRCNQTTYNNVIAAGAGVGANGGVTLGSNVTVAGNVTIGTNPTPGCTATPGYTGNPSSVLGQVVTGPHINPPPVPTFPGSGQTGVTFPGSAQSYNSATTVPQISSSDTTHNPSNASPPLVTITPGSNSFGWPCISGTACNGTAANPYLISGITLSSPSDIVTLYGGPSVDQPVYYDVNSISMSGQSQLAVNGYIVLNVRSSLSLTGKGIVNGITQEPAAVQINYAGTNSVSIGGNGAMSATVTAPNATVSLGGGGASGYMIGSIQANNVTVQGGYPIHYDVQLSRLSGTLGTVVVSSYMRRKL
jgi:Tfp pilus assembly protein PilX